MHPRSGRFYLFAAGASEVRWRVAMHLSKRLSINCVNSREARRKKPSLSKRLPLCIAGSGAEKRRRTSRVLILSMVGESHCGSVFSSTVLRMAASCEGWLQTLLLLPGFFQVKARLKRWIRAAHGSSVAVRFRNFGTH